MSTLLLTLAIAFIIVFIAITLLGIGWLLTGKSKIQAGACGRAPTHKKDSSCGTKISCQLCEHSPEQKNSTELENSASEKSDPTPGNNPHERV